MDFACLRERGRCINNTKDNGSNWLIIKKLNVYCNPFFLFIIRKILLFWYSTISICDSFFYEYFEGLFTHGNLCSSLSGFLRIVHTLLGCLWTYGILKIYDQDHSVRNEKRKRNICSDCIPGSFDIELCYVVYEVLRFWRVYVINEWCWMCLCLVQMARNRREILEGLL